MLRGAIRKNIIANENLGEAMARIMIKAISQLLPPEADAVKAEYESLIKSIVCQNELLIDICK